MRKRTRRGDPQKRRYWEGVVRRSRESGQSVRAFCQAEGLRESAFYFWRRRLARHGQHSRKGVLAAFNGSRPQARSAKPALQSPRPGCRLVPGPTPSFLPVEVVASASRSRPTNADPRSMVPGRCPSGARLEVAQVSGGVEIVLAQGHTVRVAVGFDRQTLADVLAVLEGRPC